MRASRITTAGGFSRFHGPCVAAAMVGWLAAGVVPWSCGQEPVAQPAASPQGNADGDDGDLARKAEIMNSQRWRRAIFELGEWLSSQRIYTPQEVRNIKADFNKRVTAMSSYELEYLLDDLDAKFKILETPEAKDARQWVGQYLSVMSDQKRAEVIKDVPDVVKMLQGALAFAWLTPSRGRESRRSNDTRRSRSMAGGTDMGSSPTATIAASLSSASGSMSARIDRKSMRRKPGAQASTLALERPTMSATSTAR